MYLYCVLVVGLTALEFGSSRVIDGGAESNSTKRYVRDGSTEPTGQLNPKKPSSTGEIKSSEIIKKVPGLASECEPTSAEFDAEKPSITPEPVKIEEKSSEKPLKKYPSLQYIAFEAKSRIDRGVVQARKKREAQYAKIGTDLKTVEGEMDRKLFAFAAMIAQRDKEPSRFKRHLKNVGEVIYNWFTNRY